MDEHDSTTATLPDSEGSADALEDQAQGSEGSDSLLQDQTLSEALVSADYTEQVVTYLDYINSGVICSVVLLGAILGTLVIRCFLDKVAE